MATVTFESATRTYPGSDSPAVDDLDLEIGDGEFLVLVGPSGCGKSTTLRMLAGLEPVNRGRVCIGDRDVTLVPPKDRDIAMVFQTYALYPHMTVAENIGFHLKIAKMSKKERAERIREAARILDLESLLDRKPSKLSGGQRQRVAMGRAIVREPQVFLMDEPLSNLDAKLRVSTRAQIKNLSHELKVTTVYVTHDQIEAMTLADRVVVMKQGVVQQVGTPTEIYDNPANTFVASFIGSPAMNLIQGEISGGTFTGKNVRIEGLSAPDGPVLLGFRAEDAGIADSEASAQITVPVYTIELLGDATMLTARAGGALVSVKAGKEFRAEIGDTVSFSIPPTICHLFHHETGARLGG